MKLFIHDNGAENVAVAMVRQSRMDFIKGAKILYPIFKRIPTEKELYNDKTHASLSHMEKIRYMHDAWRFVIKDPYQFFGDVGEAQIIKSWTKEAIEDYYKKLYLPGATLLFKKKVSKDKIKNGTEKELSEFIFIDDLPILRDFLLARNYIYSTLNGEKTAHSWDVEAYGRSKRKIGKKGAIAETEYAKKAMERRKKNIERAKELYEDGLSVKDIASDLKLEMSTIRNYLRS